MTYPITISRKAVEAFHNNNLDLDDIVEVEGLLEAFNEVAPDGDLVVRDVDAHIALLRGPLAPYEESLVYAGLLPAVTTTAGDYGVASAGYGGTATAGRCGVASAGLGGIAAAGEGGLATASYGGTVTAGDHGTAVTGTHGTATAGVLGTAVAGIVGIAIAGDGGTAVALDYGTAIAGDRGTAIAGFGGYAAAGHGGVIQIAYYTENRRTRKIVTGHVGEEGILPNVKYRLDTSATPPRFVRVKDGEGLSDSDSGIWSDA